MKQKMFRSKGFTLVELLIVIALIAILSVAVLATINPIEQANKARDASFKNDTAEVLNAYERYYASQNLYPWNYGTAGVAPNFPVASGTNKISFSSLDPRFGILDASGAVTTSELIRTSELKGAFGGKVPFKTPLVAQDTMYLFNDGSTYVCYCPKAKANRMSDLKCLKNISVDGSVAVATATLVDSGGAGCVAPTAAQMLLSTFCDTPSTYANLRCVPEGDIQSI